VEQLRRIEPETSGRYADCGHGDRERVGDRRCPLEQAVDARGTVNGHLMANRLVGRNAWHVNTPPPGWQQIADEARAFIDWNDEHPDEAARKADLAAALAAALAEKEGADARP
jgi:hypothetical protein